MVYYALNMVDQGEVKKNATETQTSTESTRGGGDSGEKVVFSKTDGQDSTKKEPKSNHEPRTPYEKEIAKQIEKARKQQETIDNLIPENLRSRPPAERLRFIANQHNAQPAIANIFREAADLIEKPSRDNVEKLKQTIKNLQLQEDVPDEKKDAYVLLLRYDIVDTAKKAGYQQKELDKLTQDIGLVRTESRLAGPNLLRQHLTDEQFNRLPNELQKAIREFDTILRTKPEDLRERIDEILTIIRREDIPQDPMYIPDPEALRDILLQQAMNVRDILNEQIKKAQELQADFGTFTAQFLAPDEKIRIREEGPEYWEELFDKIMFLLTANPNAEVVLENSLTSKLQALSEYIRNNGRGDYEKRGYSPQEIDRKLDEWARDLNINQSERIHQHNYLRGILLSTNAEESANIYGSILPSWFSELSGKGIEDEDKRRIVIAANRVYDQAAMSTLSHKYRRWKFLEEKNNRHETLTVIEQREFREGYMLKYEDLVAQSDIWKNARNKRHRLDVWNMVQERVNQVRSSGALITPEQALNELITENKPAWELIRDTMEREKIDEDKAIYKLKATRQLTITPKFCTEDDRGVYFEVERELAEKGGTTADKLYKLTLGEERQAESEGIYSPVEQQVYTWLKGIEKIRLQEELRAREAKGEFRDEQAKQQWLTKKEQLHHRYVQDAIRRARQHFIFSRRLQKINSAMIRLPDFDSRTAYVAPFLEYEARQLHHNAFMLARFTNYSQPVVRDMAAISRLRYLENETARKLHIAHTPEWKKMMDEAFEKEGPNTAGSGGMKIGADWVVAQLQEELGLPYPLLVEMSMVPIGGIYDLSLWRKQEFEQDPTSEVLTYTDRDHPLNHDDRVEYSLGMQFATAGGITTEEVKRIAHDFKNLETLLERIKQDINVSISTSDTPAVRQAKEHLKFRLFDTTGNTVKDKITYSEREKAIDEMLKRIRAYQVNPSDGQKAKAVTDYYDDPQFKPIAAEAGKERAKYILERIDNRLPTVVSYYFAEDSRNQLIELFITNPVLQGEMGSTNVSQLKKDPRVAEKIESVWNGLEKALFAVQNDLVRNSVRNRDVNSYFNNKLDDYLKVFLSPNDYTNYKDVCTTMTTYLRTYFDQMKEGKVGKAAKMVSEGKLSGDEAKYVGMRQLDLVSRFPFDLTLTLGDASYENAEYDRMGSQGTVKRRASEFVSNMHSNDHMNNLFTKFHKQKFTDSVAQVGGFISEIAGYHGVDPANVRGKGFVEALVEMIRAPDKGILETIPELEGMTRTFMESGAPILKKWAKEKGSRLFRITEDPHAAILQKHELHELFEIMRASDVFLGHPEIFEELFKKFHTTFPELSLYAFRRAMPYLGVILLFLMLTQVLEELKTSGQQK